MPQKELETREIKDVEVFATGTWNGDIYTDKDLESMVMAFAKTKDKIKPFLKLGHNEMQSMLEADGLPAAGWVENLRKVGNKLVADFVGVPKAIYDLIKVGSYRTVSCEIFWNFGLDGEKFPYLLKAVAILGADIPAVSTLKDIMSLYAKGEQAMAYDVNGIEVKKYDVKFTEDIEMEEQIKELTEKLANAEKLFADEKAAYAVEKETMTKTTEELKAERDGLKAKCEDLEKKYSDITEEKRVSDINAKIDELITNKKVLPAQKEMLFTIIKNIPVETKYSVDGKEMGLNELVLKFAEAYNPVSLPTEPKADGQTPKVEKFDSEDDAKHAAITKYMEEHKVSYTKAYEAIALEFRLKAAEGKTDK